MVISRTDSPRDQPKPVRWIASSKKDLSDLPDEVRWSVGGALWQAQLGVKPPQAKPLKAFGGAGVLEIVDDFDGNTFRAVYTVQFAEAVYVLHVFQKKSKRRIATPKVELDIVRRRLRQAEEEHDRWRRSAKAGPR